MKKIAKTLVKVTATAGSALPDCKREAIILSISEKVNVDLIHNNITYEIDPEKILGTVREQI